MDLNAACSGFLFGVAMADALIQQGLHRRILVIGAEVLTRFVDWSDRGTCVLFGDGAGAVVVERSTNDRQGILSTYLGSDGGLASLLCIPGGGSRNPPSQAMIERNLPVIKMEGNEVFKHAVREMSEAAERALKLAGVRKEEVDLLIPHQANIRIIEATAKRLRVPMDRVYVNIDRFGNTSAASIPIALAEAARSGRLSPGAIVVMVAFGAGFSWAGVVMRW
jgi:3-oxoacyl-[acyl-carrier-protein] synthase-3